MMLFLCPAVSKPLFSAAAVSRVKIVALVVVIGYLIMDRVNLNRFIKTRFNCL